MDIIAVIEQLDAEQARIELLKRIVSDDRFFQNIQRLANDPLGLARDIIESERYGWENTPVEDVDFSVRTFNCLKKEGLNTLGEIASKTPDELLDPAIRNFGRRSLAEVVEKLNTHGGLKLKDT